MNDDLIKKFNEIKGTLVNKLEPLVTTYFGGVFNPLMKFHIVRETQRLAEEEIKDMFPDFPYHLLPQFKFSNTPEGDVEIFVQEYINGLNGWKYIGTITMDGNELLDVYIKFAVFSSNEFTLMVKYGHGIKDYYYGGAQAQEDYLAGKFTPLSAAYQLALDEGEI